MPDSRKLPRKKTFTNFKVLWLFVKVFSAKFGGMALFGDASEQSAKVFSAKNHQFTKVFSSKSFPPDDSTLCVVLCVLSVLL